MQAAEKYKYLLVWKQSLFFAILYMYGLHWARSWLWLKSVLFQKS